MGPSIKTQAEPSESREQALRFLKQVIRDRMDRAEISLEQFSTVLQVSGERLQVHKFTLLSTAS